MKGLLAILGFWTFLALIALRPMWVLIGLCVIFVLGVSALIWLSVEGV